MTSIDLFYQGEGLGEIRHLELEPNATFAILKLRLIETHGIPHGALLFLENEDDPLEDHMFVEERASHTGLKVHIHHCRHVEVTVTFNGETVERRFSPSATMAKVKCWAAEHRFGMTDEEAGEHVLQLAGSHDRPAPGTHIGALTDGKVCGLAFDLVADQRVNGASGGAA